MVKHLGLDAKDVLDAKTGEYDESKNTLEKVETMRVFNSLKDMPEHALKPGSVVRFGGN
jgi:hypothetical protein